jgi:phosphate transport system substrate-binding protein
MTGAALRLACLVLTLGCGSALGAGDEAIPPFAPAVAASGEIRIWGSPVDGRLLQDWADGYGKYHPDARILASPHGPDSTLAGVYTGVADLAFMAREMRLPVEHMAFAWVHHYAAFSIEVANAGVRSDRLGANLAVFVHRDNPLTALTLAQLDGVLGAEHRRGAANIRRWGELGLNGRWKDLPVRVYGPAVGSIPALYIRRAVLEDSYKWNAAYREVGEDGREAVAAVAVDPAGIAYAPLRAANDRVKPLALAEQDGGAFVDLTDATVAARTYPLIRVITMVLNREPGKPVDAKVKEFLRYILSRDGQDAVARDGGYVPLSAASVRRQLERLD